MSVILHDYQQHLTDDIYGSWRAGNRNVAAVLPTGGGKSVIVSGITEQGYKDGMKQCIIAHRNELVSQMSCHIARRGIPHRIIGADETIRQITRLHRQEFGDSLINPSARTAVVGVDTLMARAADMVQWGQQQDRWIVDECFPAGTKITIPGGYKNIEDIQTGDLVLSFDEVNHSYNYKKVKRLFKNLIPHNMVRLQINQHHVIECTGGHPFWTRSGWVNAIDLDEESEILNVSVQPLWAENCPHKRTPEISIQEKRQNILHQKVRLRFPPQTLQQDGKEGRANCIMFNLRHAYEFGEILSKGYVEKDRASILQQDLFGQISSKNFFGNCSENQSYSCFKKDEIKQSHETVGNKRKSFKYIESYRAQACATRRKRERNTCSRKSFEGDSGTFRFCSSDEYTNKNGAQKWLSNLLQTRHGTSNFANCYRSGWEFSQFTEQAYAGSEERRISTYVRLESIEIFKSADNRKPLGSFVYNIEVDDFHTYVANDIVVHNCHHLLIENKWGKAVALLPNAQGLGVTATLTRADGKGLGRHADGVMDDMVVGPSMRTLIDRGFLSDYEVVCPSSDMHVEEDEVSASGDWSNKTLRKAAKKSRIVGDVVENYCKYAFGRRAIVFATDVETAGEIAAKFTAFGIRAVALSAKTPAAIREKYIAEFKSGRISVLVNVDLFDEGFDVPACDVVIMARPTASLGKYLQMVGRALRFVPGKVALIIDHVSNIVRHGFPDKHRLWSLDRRDKRSKTKSPDDIPPIACSSCSKPYERFLTACPHCGAERPLPAPRERSIDIVEGDLILLDRAALDRMRQSTKLENPGDIAARVAAAAGDFAGRGAANRQIEKIADHGKLCHAMAQWVAIEREKGFNDREIQRKFYLTTGIDVMTALDGSKARSEMLVLASRIEGWWNR